MGDAKGRAIKVLTQVEGVAPGALVTGEAGGLRLMFAERALSDGSTAIIAFGLADEVVDTSFAAMDRALHRFFPEARLVAYDWHDWLRDPWSSGTWVSHGLGQSPLFAGQEWAQKGLLHFATSDIASRESGWFEGAVLAGESAADAILADPRGWAGRRLVSIRLRHRHPEPIHHIFEPAVGQGPLLADAEAVPAIAIDVAGDPNARCMRHLRQRGRRKGRDDRIIGSRDQAKRRAICRDHRRGDGSPGRIDRHGKGRAAV